MTTDKDLAEMFRASQNVDVLHLSDNEILQGFKDANSNIVREYFYGYCRIAYCIYDKRYGLRTKPGMDFFTLAHEYFLYLIEHDFKPLEDRKSSMSLKTWMVNGFRYMLLDRLKGVEKSISLIVSRLIKRNHHRTLMLLMMNLSMSLLVLSTRFAMNTMGAIIGIPLS